MAVTYDIPHFQQQYSNACGAACLQMLYNYFGLKIGQGEIWRRVSGLQDRNGLVCWANLMVLDACNQQIFGSIHHSSDLYGSLKIALENDIIPFILYRRSPENNVAHYSVVVGTSDENIFVNDPFLPCSQGKSMPISIKRLNRLAKSQSSDDAIIPKSNTILAFKKNIHIGDIMLGDCESCGHKFPLVNFAARLVGNTTCPFCAERYSF